MASTSDAIAAIALQRRQSLTAIVYSELERMILSGELAAGSKVNEQSLALRLGVSRGPVREARRLLERTGLVTAVANQGVFVRDLDRREIAENYDMRAMVTGFICGLAATRATAAQVKSLRAGIRLMGQAIRRGDATGYHQANAAFHEQIAGIAGHGRARQFYGDLAKEAHMHRRVGSALAQSNAEHGEIVDAIAAGKADLARQLGEEHVLAGKRRWLAAHGDAPD